MKRPSRVETHPGALARALLPAVVTAAALMALLALWIRAEPVDVTRGLQIALGAAPAVLFGAIVWYAHRAGR